MNSRLRVSSLILLLGVVCCGHLPERGDDEAVISIGEPTVFRRERSLVERFEDLEWLRLQRSPEKEKEYEQEFQGSSRTATAESTAFALELAIGEALAAAPAADDGATGGGTTASTGDGAATSDDSQSTGADPRAAFAALGDLPEAKLSEALDKLNAATPKVLPRDRLKNRVAFRDTVAEEIRKRSLDDVHDLAGLALYELQFDLTLVAGADTGHSYVVALEVEPAISAPLDPTDAASIVATMRSACLARIVSATASISGDDPDDRQRASVDDSGEIGEAILRGIYAARYADMQRIAQATVRIEELQSRPCKVLEQVEFYDHVADLVSSGLLAQSAADDLARLGFVCKEPLGEKLHATLSDWNGSSLSEQSVLDRIASDEDGQVVGRTLAGMSNACNVHLDAIGKRQTEVIKLGDLLKTVLALSRIRPDSGRKVDRSRQETLRRRRDELSDFGAEIDRIGSLEAGATRTFAWADYDPYAGIPVRSPQSQARFTQMLVDLEQLNPLSRVDIEDLKASIRVQNAAAIRKNAERAIGFVIARNVARASGGALTYCVPSHLAGLDASTTLSELLAGEVANCHLWKMPSAGQTRVVGVTPTEVAEQMPFSAYSDIRSAFSIALAGLFRGSVSSANAAFERASQELRRYETIARNPILVGFVGGDVASGAPSNSFGWVIGPRLETSTEGDAELRYRSAASHHAVTASLVAPATASRVTLRYRVFRIDECGRWIRASSIDEAVRSGDRVDSRTITVQLPNSVETVAEAMLARSDPRATKPTLSPGQQWRMQAGERSGITILGAELWRNPQVYVDGQRATRVQILSDLGGLWAEFDKLEPLAGQSEETAFADLVVSTSRGTVRTTVGRVTVLPPRKNKKSVEPKIQPPVQVVVARTADSGRKATIDLRFELTPPIPIARDEVVASIRRKGAANAKAITIPPDLIRVDPEKPEAFEILGLQLDGDPPWRAVDGFEMALKVRDNALAELRALHPAPVEVVLVAPTIACTPLGQTELVGLLADGRWKLSDTTVVEIATDPALEPRHHDLFLPELKTGGLVPARASVDGEAEFAARIGSKAGDVGRVWRVELPKGVILVPGSPAQLPASTTLRVGVGRARFEATIRLRSKANP